MQHNPRIEIVNAATDANKVQERTSFSSLIKKVAKPASKGINMSNNEIMIDAYN
jgi:hypothetical protein